MAAVQSPRRGQLRDRGPSPRGDQGATAGAVGTGARGQAALQVTGLERAHGGADLAVG